MRISRLPSLRIASVRITSSGSAATSVFSAYLIGLTTVDQL
jgi:hypothetical protein